MTCKIDLGDLVGTLQQVQPKPILAAPSRAVPRAASELRGGSLMDVLVEESRALREGGAMPATVVPTFLEQLGYAEGTPFYEAGLCLSSEAEMTMSQPSYHNPQHITEVVIVAYCLGLREHLLQDRIAELVLAAVSHDLGHTGGINQVAYELESRLIELAEPILRHCLVPEESIDRIREMILATDFVNGVKPARSNYRLHRESARTAEPRMRAAACLLLTEADVLFSCFNKEYNESLSRLLCVEWKRTEENLPFKMRIGFLNSVEFISDAATELGLDLRRRDLIRILQEQEG